ncbi:hypothetical protein ACHHYP_15518 [Achlya hypogyna]|uniref:Uncharacterized protein n=1 Tax=Achlya hypogyna TaxID=1202772 RepID=A0A1V9YAP4_ACHHY|nr:hypothetical protein ACHHYP_15518 [Achlya hypogyna]
MGQCCSKKHDVDVEVDYAKQARPQASPVLEVSPSSTTGFAGLETTAHEVPSLVLSSTAEICHDNNSPTASPEKAAMATYEEEPQDHVMYVRPEDRPIESAFIREERKRLAMIQEQQRIEREMANAKWMQELAEKKREFLPP